MKESRSSVRFVQFDHTPSDYPVSALEQAQAEAGRFLDSSAVILTSFRESLAAVQVELSALEAQATTDTDPRIAGEIQNRHEAIGLWEDLIAGLEQQEAAAERMIAMSSTADLSTLHLAGEA